MFFYCPLCQKELTNNFRNEESYPQFDPCQCGQLTLDYSLNENKIFWAKLYPKDCKGYLTLHFSNNQNYIIALFDRKSFIKILEKDFVINYNDLSTQIERILKDN